MQKRIENGGKYNVHVKLTWQNCKEDLTSNYLNMGDIDNHILIIEPSFFFSEAHLLYVLYIYVWEGSIHWFFKNNKATLGQLPSCGQYWRSVPFASPSSYYSLLSISPCISTTPSFRLVQPTLSLCWRGPWCGACPVLKSDITVRCSVTFVPVNCVLLNMLSASGCARDTGWETNKGSSLFLYARKVLCV